MIKNNGCKTLALYLLNDACNDVKGIDDTDPCNIIYRSTDHGEAKRLKDNALNFFFDGDSEKDARFWCEISGQPLGRFRWMLKKYLK